MRKKLKELYEQMYSLTNVQCQKDCIRVKDSIGSCCSAEYCDYAIEHAQDFWKIDLEETGHPHYPLMGKTGCTAPPHLRPICTLHVCDKSFRNQEFYEKYFTLRSEIEDLEFKIDN